jgi:hypothetical protein
VHFLSSACGHNKDVSCRRAELTREGHNFNCAAGAVGSFYLGRRSHPNFNLAARVPASQFCGEIVNCAASRQQLPRAFAILPPVKVIGAACQIFRKSMI